MATTDGQMDLIPLDQIIPRPVGTMAAGCGAAVRAYKDNGPQLRRVGVAACSGAANWLRRLHS